MGKSAIDAKRGNIFFLDPFDLVIIGIDTQDGPDHPLYPEGGPKDARYQVDEPMARNILLHGVIEDIVARKVEIDGKDVLVVVAGRRRTINARAARKMQHDNGAAELLVPVKIVKDTDDAVMGIMVSENEHRTGIDMLAKAKQAAKLLRFGRSEEEVATDYGIDKKTLKDWLRLLEAAPPVLKAAQAGELSPGVPFSMSAAAKLAALPRDRQEGALVELREVAKSKPTGKVSQHDARAVANKVAGRAKPDAGSASGIGGGNVGISSRKVWRAMREEMREGDEASKQYTQGAIDMLTLLLGDEKPGGDIKKLVKKALREAKE